MTLRERLLSAKTAPAGDYTLSGSGEKVYLRRWSVGDRIKFAAIAHDAGRSAFDRQAAMLALILADESNVRIFPDGDTSVFDVQFGEDADKIIDQAIAANGMGSKDGAEKKANSNPTTS